MNIRNRKSNPHTDSSLFTNIQPPSIEFKKLRVIGEIKITKIQPTNAAIFHLSMPV